MDCTKDQVSAVKALLAEVGWSFGEGQLWGEGSYVDLYVPPLWFDASPQPKLILKYLHKKDNKSQSAGSRSCVAFLVLVLMNVQQITTSNRSSSVTLVRQ